MHRNAAEKMRSIWNCLKEVILVLAIPAFALMEGRRVWNPALKSSGSGCMGLDTFCMKDVFIICWHLGQRYLSEFCAAKWAGWRGEGREEEPQRRMGWFCGKHSPCLPWKPEAWHVSRNQRGCELTRCRRMVTGGWRGMS